MLIEAEDLVAYAIRRIAWEFPLHGRVLSRFAVRPDASVRRLGITLAAGELALAYEPAYVERLGVERCAGLLLHALNHVVFGHLEMSTEVFSDREALVVAQEVTANEWVPIRGLPSDSLQIAQFGLAPGEDTRTRYEMLEGIVRERAVPDLTPAEGEDPALETIDDHSGWENGDREVARVLQRAAVEDAFASLSDAEIARVPPALVQALGLECGSAAGREIERIVPARGRVSWRRHLASFIASTVRAEPSTSWPSRRAPDLVGIVPGRRMMAAQPNLVIAVDTSGSLTKDHLSAIYGELRALRGLAKMVVVQCDTEIHSIAPFDGRVAEIVGRGGTDLRPPFEKEVLRRLNADGIVYFTDGHGPAPEKAPRVPVLWCLTPGGTRPVPWGRAIWLA